MTESPGGSGRGDVSVQKFNSTLPRPQEKNISVYAREKQRETVEAVLDARAKFPQASLADLYDPLTMPTELTKAHAELDKAVEKCYRSEAFTSDRQRVEFLFDLCEKLTSPLTAGTAPKARKKNNALPDQLPD